MKRSIPLLLIPFIVLILYYPVIFTYFSQDDFFHFKVSLTDGSLLQFINLFGFHPFAERGIAFYRPIFRESLFNIFYSLFGLSPYPFRVLQFLLLFLNSTLVYYLIRKLINIKYLPFFTAFFYAISAAQVSPLFYLAGGIQVLGATTFLLLTLIFALKNPFLSFITFLLGLASHELTSITPFLITALLFVRNPFKKALGKLWQVLPFFLVLFAYLYLEISRIGFSNGEKQYQVVLSLKSALNSYMWYAGWAIGLPEMLIDFVFPGFNLNPNLMKYWGGYYFIIFSTFFVSLLFLALGTGYCLFKKRKTILNKKILFFLFWFLVSLLPVILLPLHKSTQYLETGLAAFWTIIGFIILNTYQELKFGKAYLIILLISLFALSTTSIVLQRTTYWAAERGKYAKQLIEQVTITYPTLPKGSVLYFENDPSYPFIAKAWGSSSKQAAFILNNEDALRLIYKDSTLKVYYQDLNQPPGTYPKDKIYTLKAKIF